MSSAIRGKQLCVVITLIIMVILCSAIHLCMVRNRLPPKTSISGSSSSVSRFRCLEERMRLLQGASDGVNPSLEQRVLAVPRSVAGECPDDFSHLVASWCFPLQTGMSRMHRRATRWVYVLA